MEYKDTHNKSNDQIESDDLIKDAHGSDALRYSLIALWTVNPHLLDTFTSPLPNFQLRPQNQQRQTAVSDDKILCSNWSKFAVKTTYYKISVKCLKESNMQANV